MKRIRKLFLFLALVPLVALMTGCGSTPVDEGGDQAVHRLSEPDSLKSGQVEPRARNLFLEGERYYRAKNYKAAANTYRKVVQRFPKTRAAAFAGYRLGTLFYHVGQYAKASLEFRRHLQQHPTSSLRFDVTYNLAASEFQLGNYAQTEKILSELSPQEIRSQGNARAEFVYDLSGQAAQALGHHRFAIVSKAASLQLPIAPQKRATLVASIDQHLSRIEDRGVLQTLLGEVSEPQTQTKISKRLSALAPQPSEQFATSQEVPHPEPVEGLVDAGSGDRRSIGVILPLSGKGAAYGRRALDGILLASGIFAREGSPFQLNIEDSESNASVAAQAVDKLVRESSVMAILGPLSWNESLAVAERCQQLGVPNLSFTSKEGLSRKGAYLFQNALTPRVQLEEMVRYVTQDKGFRRFAILAPKNSFGEEMAKEFWTLVEQNGAHIVAYERFAENTTDFQDSVKALLGLADPSLRKAENAALLKITKEYQEKYHRPSKARLPPIIDFDALFVPDLPGPVGQIAASLAYFDASGIPLLGTTEWNSDQLFRRGGRHVEGAIFPGAISPYSRNPQTKEFIRLFSENYGNPPDLLSAQAFEATHLIMESIRRSGSSNRNSIVTELSTFQNYDTPLGKLSFDSSRLAIRQLPVFALLPGGNVVQQ